MSTSLARAFVRNAVYKPTKYRQIYWKPQNVIQKCRITSLRQCRQALSKQGSFPFLHQRVYSSASPSKQDGAPVSWKNLVAVMVAGAAMVGYYNYEKERRLTKVSSNKVTTIGEASIGGKWLLVDVDGNLVSDEDYLGKFVLVYFGFTNCPDICPNELVKIGNIVNALDKNKATKDQIHPIFISIDPRRDTVGQMKQYQQDFHPKIKYLTGTPDQVTSIAKAYRVYWSKVDEVIDDDDEEDYSVDHTIVLYLMGRNGKFIDLFTQSVEEPQIVRRIAEALNE
jgi:protein SCO1